jgi:hypothetical protein
MLTYFVKKKHTYFVRLSFDPKVVDVEKHSLAAIFNLGYSFTLGVGEELAGGMKNIIF